MELTSPEQVLERLSIRTFLGTLTTDEYVCLVAMYAGFTQKLIAKAFGLSPAKVNRTIQSVRQKFTEWNRA